MAIRRGPLKRLVRVRVAVVIIVEGDLEITAEVKEKVTAEGEEKVTVGGKAEVTAEVTEKARVRGNSFYT